MSELVYISGFSGGDVVEWEKTDHGGIGQPLPHPASSSLRIKIRPMRTKRSVAWGSSCPVLRAFMKQKRLKRLANRSRQLGIERRLDTALSAAKRMHGIRIRHTDNVIRKLVILNELHTCSLSLRGTA